jgi:hypothetical protein
MDRCRRLCPYWSDITLLTCLVNPSLRIEVMKVQVIRSKRRPPRFFVNVPLPLAAALDLAAGEEVQWQLLARSDLRLKRLAAPRPLRAVKK